MALSNLVGWAGGSAAASCGTACGAGEAPAKEDASAACGTACGAGEAPAEEEAPAACGSACGAAGI